MHPRAPRSEVWWPRGISEDPKAPTRPRRSGRVPVWPVPPGKGDARPRGFSLGRKTRSPRGPTRDAGAREQNALAAPSPGPPASSPRGRPSPASPLPRPAAPGPSPAPGSGGRGSALHILFRNFSNRARRRLPAPRPPGATRHRRGLSGRSGRPRRASARALPCGLPLPSLPRCRRRGREPGRRFTSSSCGRTVQRAPGLCQVVVPPPPLVGLHTKRLRGSRRRRPPAPERRWGWRCRGAAAAGGDAGRACAGRGDTAALRRAEEAQPRPRLHREPARGCTPARSPRSPARRPARSPAPRAHPHPPPSRRGALPAARAPRSGSLAHTQGPSRERRESTREQRAPRSRPFFRRPNPRLPRARRGRAPGWTAPPPVWRQDLAARAPPGGRRPSGRAEEEEPRWREAEVGRR